MTKHTLGPWIIGHGDGLTGPTTMSVAGATVLESVRYDDWERTGEDGDEPSPTSISVSAGSETVAIVPTEGLGNGQANAHLIAAAPELYDELEQAARVLDALSANSIAKKLVDSVLPGIHAALAKAKGEPHDR
jgi:hypothetical protein